MCFTLKKAQIAHLLRFFNFGDFSPPLLTHLFQKNENFFFQLFSSFFTSLRSTDMKENKIKKKKFWLLDPSFPLGQGLWWTCKSAETQTSGNPTGPGGRRTRESARDPDQWESHWSRWPTDSRVHRRPQVGGNWGPKVKNFFSTFLAFYNFLMCFKQ